LRVFQVCPEPETSLKLAHKFRAEQVLTKIAYDSRMHQWIYDCVAEWGLGFLKLSIRVVYVLEKQTLMDLNEKDPQGTYYDKFQLFKIFAKKYGQTLEEFLLIKNQSLLALLKAWQHGSNEDLNEYKMVESLCSQSLDRCKEIRTVQTLASIGETASTLKFQSTTCKIHSGEKEFFERTFTQAKVLEGVLGTDHGYDFDINLLRPAHLDELIAAEL